MQIPTFENKWTQEELDQWLDTLVDFQQEYVLQALKEVAAEGKDVLRFCNLLREKMEEKGQVVTQFGANYKTFSAIFSGFQDGIIQWRLFSGNITEKNIFF